MPKSPPNILYSQNCELSYRITEDYYDSIHYAWCATRFGSPGLDDTFTKNPRTSVPYIRYQELEQDTGESGRRIGDRHSVMIEALKAGIKRGAELKFITNIITEEEKDEIIEIVNAAQIQDFAPLMFIIPFEKVKKIAKKVPPAKRAHPLSDEWIIDKLPRKNFDVVKF